MGRPLCLPYRLSSWTWKRCNMALDADKFLKIAVGLGILTAGVGVGYHYVIYVPAADRAKVERSERLASEREEAADQINRERRERYNSCISDAEENYNRGWNSDCKTLGIDKRRDDCILPEFNVNSWNKLLKDDKAKCLEEFKSGI